MHAGSASAAAGLERIAVKARTTAPAIGTTATTAHALLLRRGTDTVLIGFERRLLIVFSSNYSNGTGSSSLVELDREDSSAPTAAERPRNTVGPGDQFRRFSKLNL